MKLDDRLLAVASCVPAGAYLADVGTDHGYLPIYLAEKNMLTGAVASDIHKAPLESADKNIRNATENKAFQKYVFHFPRPLLSFWCA